MTKEEKETIMKQVLSDINVSKIFIDNLIERLIKRYYLTKDEHDIRNRVEETVINELEKVTRRFAINVNTLIVKRKEIINDEFEERMRKKSFVIKSSATSW